MHTRHLWVSKYASLDVLKQKQHPFSTISSTRNSWRISGSKSNLTIKESHHANLDKKTCKCGHISRNTVDLYRNYVQILYNSADRGDIYIVYCCFSRVLVVALSQKNTSISTWAHYRICHLFGTHRLPESIVTNQKSHVHRIHLRSYVRPPDPECTPKCGDSVSL